MYVGDMAHPLLGAMVYKQIIFMLNCVCLEFAYSALHYHQRYDLLYVRMSIAQLRIAQAYATQIYWGSLLQDTIQLYNFVVYYLCILYQWEKTLNKFDVLWSVGQSFIHQTFVSRAQKVLSAENVSGMNINVVNMFINDNLM